MKHKLDQIKKKIANCKEVNQPKRVEPLKIKHSAIGFSLEIVAAIAVGFLIGFYLDKWLNFKFLFKIACSLLAFIASFVSIYRIFVKTGNKK